jgi:hypothetical protein
VERINDDNSSESPKFSPIARWTRGRAALQNPLQALSTPTSIRTVGNPTQYDPYLTPEIFKATDQTKELSLSSSPFLPEFSAATKSDILSPHSPAAAACFPPTKDEQIVNSALVLFLKAVTVHFVGDTNWSVQRKVFNMADKENKMFEARVDGILLRRHNHRIMAIVKGLGRASSLPMPARPQILFWLAPRSGPALECLNNPANQHYVGSVPGMAGPAFVIGFGCPSQTPECLVTLGRRADIEISGSQISTVQCQILLHPKTREILIRDKSSLQSTRVYYHSDPKSLYLSDHPGIPRQVVIRHGDAVQLRMGGDNYDLLQFDVIWPPPDPASVEEVEEAKKVFLAQPQNPALAVTHPDTSTQASRYESRVQTPGSGKPWLHRKLTLIGAGAFGDVHKTVNMHTGEYFAVKTLRRPLGFGTDTEWRKSVLSEASLLQKLFHVSDSFRISCFPTLSPCPFFFHIPLNRTHLSLT